VTVIEWTDAQEAIAKFILCGVVVPVLVLVVLLRLKRALRITWRDVLEDLVG
jgi:hypothetical protein